MALGIERQCTQRARRSAGFDERLGPFHERASKGTTDSNNENVTIGRHRVVGRGAVIALGADGEGLDDDPVFRSVPGQRECAHAELFLDGLLKRIPVIKLARRQSGDGRLPACTPDDFVKQRVHTLSQGTDLFFLEDHCRQSGAVARLQEEGALTGLANGAGDEAIRRVEPEDLMWHRSDPIRSRRRRPLRRQ